MERPGPDLGPDPRLNGTGVPLTWRQRGILGVIAAAIGLALVLLLFGVPWAAPETPGSASAPRPYRVVLDGAGRAVVALQQNGVREQPAEMRLPRTLPLDSDVRSVVVDVRLRGVDTGSGIGCAVIDASGEELLQSRASGDDATVRCQTVLP